MTIAVLDKDGATAQVLSAAELTTALSAIQTAVTAKAGTQAVSGTFWQATQPVSGTVGVSGSVAVTGTFWQATQPVSGALSNTGVTVTTRGDGSVGTTAETITIPANQSMEFFNLGASVIWASWTGTAAANTAGSFPIPALASGVAGFYAPPAGASGSLSIVSASGTNAFTCQTWG